MPPNSRTPDSNWKSTPCARCRSAKTVATSLPRTRRSGSESISTTVTGQPAARAAAAVSSPIQPAPITTTLHARRQAMS